MYRNEEKQDARRFLFFLLSLTLSLSSLWSFLSPPGYLISLSLLHAYISRRGGKFPFASRSEYQTPSLQNAVYCTSSRSRPATVLIFLFRAHSIN